MHASWDCMCASPLQSWPVFRDAPNQHPAAEDTRQSGNASATADGPALVPASNAVFDEAVFFLRSNTKVVIKAGGGTRANYKALRRFAIKSGLPVVAVPGVIWCHDGWACAEYACRRIEGVNQRQLCHAGSRSRDCYRQPWCMSGRLLRRRLSEGAYGSEASMAIWMIWHITQIRLPCLVISPLFLIS